jgi:hypothetical protein
MIVSATIRKGTDRSKTVAKQWGRKWGNIVVLRLLMVLLRVNYGLREKSAVLSE